MSTCLPDGVTVKHPLSLFIGGQWVASNGGTIAVVNPNTEQASAVVAAGNFDDMDAAVAAARNAFDVGPWRVASAHERADYLRKMAGVLERRSSELAAAFIHQVGALASFAPFAVMGGNGTFAQYAEITADYPWEAEQPCSLPGHQAIIMRDAVGVVAAIAPWNNPYPIMAQKVAAALAAGCTIIMKPAPETPLEAYIIAEAAEEVGLPAGVINLVTAHREASDYLVCHAGVDKITFTGSTVAGKRIASAAGERIARVTLELGGKSPALVLDDYPIAEAAKILARAATVISGQVCAMLSRIIVSKERHDELAAALVKELQLVNVGYSTDTETEMGPIALKRQLERIEYYVELGLQDGATLACGGKRPAQLTTGYFFEPTLFCNVKNSMRIAQEEIFGPVLVLIPANNLEDAIAIANDTPYGLNSAVMTKDPQKAKKIARQLRAGNVAQNGLKADFNLPFGGYKQSGVGREGGVEGIVPFVETKVVILEQ